MITQWIQKMISYLLVMSAVLHVIPGKDYEKYIRFFCGVVLILLVLSPAAAWKGMKLEQIYQSESYLEYKRQIEQLPEVLLYGNDSTEGVSWKENQNEQGQSITVEEIRIGQ